MDGHDLPALSIPNGTPTDTPPAPLTANSRRRPTNALTRISPAATKRRVDAIACAITTGIHRIDDLFAWSQETDSATGRPWNIKPRTIIKYRNRAYAVLEAEAAESRDRSRARQLGMRRQLYAQAVSMMNVPAALAVAKDESELLGLYPDKNSTPTIGTVNVIAGAVQQADPKYIAWLEAQPVDYPTLAANEPILLEEIPVDDDLPSCDEQDAAAVDHI